MIIRVLRQNSQTPLTTKQSCQYGNKDNRKDSKHGDKDTGKDKDTTPSSAMGGDSSIQVKKKSLNETVRF